MPLFDYIYYVCHAGFIRAYLKTGGDCVFAMKVHKNGVLTQWESRCSMTSLLNEGSKHVFHTRKDFFNYLLGILYAPRS